MAVTSDAFCHGTAHGIRAETLQFVEEILPCDYLVPAGDDNVFGSGNLLQNLMFNAELADMRLG